MGAQWWEKILVHSLTLFPAALLVTHSQTSSPVLILPERYKRWSEGEWFCPLLAGYGCEKTLWGWKITSPASGALYASPFMGTCIAGHTSSFGQQMRAVGREWKHGSSLPWELLPPLGNGVGVLARADKATEHPFGVLHPLRSEKQEVAGWLSPLLLDAWVSDRFLWEQLPKSSMKVECQMLALST